MSELRKKITIDSAGNEALIGIFGESFSDRLDDISVQFQYNYFDERFDVSPQVVTGDGATSVSGELATVSSASVGTALRSSRNTIQYNAGRTGFGFFTASFNGAGKGWAGPFDLQDGFILEVSNGIASFGYLKSGVEKGSDGALGLDPQASWNGNIKPDLIDFTKVNIFLITFGYLGVANATLWVKKDNWYVLHSMKTEGRLTETHVDSPVFPISLYAKNGMTIKSGSWAGGIVGGRSDASSRGLTFPNEIVSGSGTTTQGQATVAANTTNTVVVFHSKDLFHGKTNHVKARLTGFDFKVDVPGGVNNGVVIFQVVGVISLSGTPTYDDIDATSSTIEYDHTPGSGASVSVTSGRPIITRPTSWIGAVKGGSSGEASINADAIGAFAYAGDTFAVLAKNIGPDSVVVRVTLNWEELF